MTKPAISKPVRKYTPLDCWMHYLNNAEGELLEEIAETEPMIRKAIAIEQEFMKDENNRKLYEECEKARKKKQGE